MSLTDSIWSVASIAITATVMSATSGYSAPQIESATKELLQIFLEDGELVPLYLTAIQRVNIGAQRLQRNIWRLLKGFAKALQSEADRELDLLAARLVALKAAYVARSIVERYEVNILSDLATGLDLPHDFQCEQEDSDEEEESEGGIPEDDVDEDLIEDLLNFRKFLAEGEAFASFRRKLESFVLPRQVEPNDYSLGQETLQLEVPAPPTNADFCTEIKDDLLGMRHCQNILGESRRVLASLLIARCGESFFGDVKEYRPGEAQTLIEQMNRSTGAKVTVTSYSKTSGNQNWVLKTPRMVRRLTGSLTSGRAGASNPQGCLPQHNESSQPVPSTGTAATGTTTAQVTSTLHLLACAHRTQRRKWFLQNPIDTIFTDRALFCFMRQQLERNRSLIRSILTMTSVQGMFFVKFRLRMGNTVEVRDHNPCCTSANLNTCECIPPVANVEPSPDAEYRCSPAGPLATWPPVLSQDLMHMLSSPQCINEQEIWVLEQLPKRTSGQLQERTGQPAEGWGVYYQEGIDFDIIITVVFVVFLFASLLFGVLWTRFEMDIEGAFGVSSYMITTIGILLAMIANRAKNVG
ncbi:hypothetical protein E8E12_009384 [Didymella heteroderae]|uniref:Uncharacterized protein n=1 Tax=Didymella heteroderae TaxID=1769908 RepID=A0A9P5C3X2_9PLEO|nr:hypothetical protein E8E12_009384 [Didymella heteroderae]